ncbi:MucB/RseB C-terminal domain-containing protein [Parendozoicomonas sp. Alg238-R29]|uniref:MucB/RseB C-terminal domain-containing protein n=1 Tax=Parendozoicomonas sp. Alg238-R29 TaxID=2993446 RepID=UPI00248E9FAA|nr:MucB/RseB C-terminal domain-containing protein [Parendozoicomonas sp. Alg238-R29]
MGKGKLGSARSDFSTAILFSAALFSCSLFLISPASRATSESSSPSSPSPKIIPALAAPADWLMRMVSAPDRISYRGVLIYENAAGLMTFRVFHQPTEKDILERLIYQDGPYREIVRKGDQVAFIRPGGDVSRFHSEGMSALIERIANFQDDLRRSYRLLFGGEDRVAGRTVLRIDVQSRDNHRYGFTLWLDRETGLLLRSEMIGEKGAVLERMQFADFSIQEAIPSKDLEPSREVTWVKKEAVANKSDSSEASPSGWDAGWIPAGFEVTGYNRIDSPVSKQKVDSVLYSDGLSAFSVFVEEDESRVLGPASEQIGATSAVSRVFRKGDTYYNVTVIGEVPLGTAERVAVSVKPQR